MALVYLHVRPLLQALVLVDIVACSAVTSSILLWLQDNELSDIQGRQRAYTAVCSLWKSAQEKAREAAWLAKAVPQTQEDDISAVEESHRAYSDFVGSLVRSCLLLERSSTSPAG